MTKDIMLFVLFLAVLLLCAWPLGKYMARVFNYEKTCGERFFAPLENIFYKMAKVDPRCRNAVEGILPESHYF